MRCPEYGTCKMVNLCKRHCVRKALEQDGWVLDENNQLVRKQEPAAE